MSEKIKLSITPAVAAYVRPGTPSDSRLAGCDAAADMEPFERITLLFCLSKDSEQTIRLAAVRRIEKLPEDVIRHYTESDNAHPLILDTLARICGDRSSIDSMRSDHVRLPRVTDGTSQYIDEEPVSLLQSDASDVYDSTDDTDDQAELKDDSVNEEGEQFLSKYKISQMMGIGEKIKMALTGDKEWRSMLVKDSNKLVSGSVIKNPRITESEVLKLIMSGIPNDEIMRLICANKEWIKSYQIRKGLIENNRTPVQNAMRYLATMGEKDLAGFAKSKNISSVVSTMAKRLLLNKKR